MNASVRAISAWPRASLDAGRRPWPCSRGLPAGGRDPRDDGHPIGVEGERAFLMDAQRNAIGLRMISDSGLWRARTAAPMIPVSSCGAATPRGIQGLEGDEWLPLGGLLLLSGFGRISSSPTPAITAASSS